jgi:hypothetical protein
LLAATQLLAVPLLEALKYQLNKQLLSVCKVFENFSPPKRNKFLSVALLKGKFAWPTLVRRKPRAHDHPFSRKIWRVNSGSWLIRLRRVIGDLKLHTRRRWSQQRCLLAALMFRSCRF